MNSILSKQYPNREVVEEEKHLANDIGWILLPDRAPLIASALLDCGEGRIQRMQDQGIDVQVLSLISPGVQALDPSTGTALARRVNDRLAEIVKEHPDRFVGLASLAAQSPDEAADELERAVRELGLRGASINSHVKGEYMDDRKYWVIFERAEKLGVPIYLHPRAPSAAMVEPYTAYPSLPAAMLGYGAETSLHAMRLICGGVFDRHPGLKIILGHLGEALPFWQWRIDNMWRRSPLAKTVEKTPGQYLRENFCVTTSGNFSIPAFLCAYLVFGASNILFAVDYPLESNRQAVEFMNALPISPEDKEKISHLNAEKLFAV